MRQVSIGGLRNGGVNQDESRIFPYKSSTSMFIYSFYKHDLQHQKLPGGYQNRDANYGLIWMSPHFGGMV
jgi:hypothetical protein